jgi:diguanylate cyclase (GGDEF)-like protein
LKGKPIRFRRIYLAGGGAQSLLRNEKQVSSYKFLTLSLLLAIAMGSTLPLYNALVSYPALIKVMQENIEQGAVKTAHHIVADFTSLNAMTFSGPLPLEEQRIIQNLKTDYEMVGVKIYDPAGLVIFSTRSKDLGKTNTHDYFQQQVAKGQTLNKLVNKKQLSMEGVEVHRDVSEIYVPVMVEDRFVGAFEFYFDVTAQKLAIDDISAASLRVFLGVFFGFLALFGIFALKMRQAIKKRRQVEQEIIQLAYTDTLTGLPNRRLFMDRFEQALLRAQRDNLRVTLFYLDLDHFKSVNDSYGHQQGDNLLIHITRRIKHQIRTSDTLARLGGDEFVLLAPDLHQPEEAVTIARALNRLTEKPCILEGQEIAVSLSIGVAIYPEDGQDPETLLRRADDAMYAAKGQGRNTYATCNSIRTHSD